MRFSLYSHLYLKIWHSFHIPQFWLKMFFWLLKSQISKCPDLSDILPPILAHLMPYRLSTKHLLYINLYETPCINKNLRKFYYSPGQIKYLWMKRLESITMTSIKSIWSAHQFSNFKLNMDFLRDMTNVLLISKGRSVIYFSTQRLLIKLLGTVFWEK